jgi:hypothetical protein
MNCSMSFLLLEFLLRNLLFWWVCLYMQLADSVLQLSVFFPCTVYTVFYV